MKATIDIDDMLYRRLKAEAATRGRKVKELVAEGIVRVLEEPRSQDTVPRSAAARPPWFASLRRYAGNARGRHDLASMRESVARGRSSE